MPEKPDDLLDDLRESLEGLRSKIVDLEATAHAAAETMDRLPYLPRRPRTPQESEPTWTEEETRNLGRMQSLVYVTASAAESLLDDVKELIKDAYSDCDPDRGPSDRGGGNGAPGGPSGTADDNGAPGGPSGGSGPKSPRSDGSQSPSKPAPARGPDQPHGQNGRGFRSMPGGIILDMRPIPPHL